MFGFFKKRVGHDNTQPQPGVAQKEIGFGELASLLANANGLDRDALYELIVLGMSSNPNILRLQIQATTQYLRELPTRPNDVDRPWLGAAVCNSCEMMMVRVAGNESAASSTTCRKCNRTLEVTPWCLPRVIRIPGRD